MTGDGGRALILGLFDDEAADAKAKAYCLGALLILVNVAVWLWAYLSFRDYPLLLGTASLAYTLGLRHAVDPDHIAAIDNVTRKLMQDGKRPLAVGLFFAMGHSTVVIAASLLVAVSVGALEARFEGFKAFGGVIGTGVSAVFLLVIALINTMILISVYRAFQASRRGDHATEQELRELLQQRGFFARMLRSLFALITRSWQMYPLGFLFGLGFDTASEIGLIGISAAQGSAGLPVWSILVFPALFTAGMSLIDTADGIIMVQAYGWAFRQPVRKLYYNLTMTLISIIVALLIGGIEALGLIASKLDLQGPFWELVGKISDDFSLLGYLIVAVFIAAWLISVLVYRLGRFDEIKGESPVG
ncbi:HoxN/HupN/NixA family nickel/cobalt transporter [Bradyrhizobium sp. ORS 111]|uniref:HoxN/HupN/NixA family nickel/cobalt transporter n=1 Tax=Bradyrhizobium sp. ORS 111 TaxID=1685958 RepID=UPI00388F713A